MTNTLLWPTHSQTAVHNEHGHVPWQNIKDKVRPTHFIILIKITISSWIIFSLTSLKLWIIFYAYLSLFSLCSTPLYIQLVKISWVFPFILIPHCLCQALIIIYPNKDELCPLYTQLPNQCLPCYRANDKGIFPWIDLLIIPWICC